ncbi:GntR family transcriptional regulator [Pseudoruegeria sp. SHC-113]|uniref:GntR family transcriptional regulator n=1 Tax=Pseudoruegeria sp. SHC-113 TaxID=2855439 RepID=UPI0021BAA2F5|nr:GntR family transcriptional regulator [Pseudoruegeria sp. SHC-113]MCT8161708.1 GntR family transcriptional regulator [Pseudoruegeria sp. SHC-113]
MAETPDAPAAKRTKENKDVYSRLMADIGTGAFPSGTRLKVQDLAKRYGTSIIPVREALRLLQGEGLIEIAPNRGATVATLNAEMIQEIFEILQLLEPYFVSYFAKVCTEADIAELEARQALLEQTPVRDKAAFTGHDLEFHKIIARKHYNRRAFGIWELQRRLLNALALPIPISNARHREILEQHHELIEALRQNDGEAALAAINRHVAGAGDQMYLQLRSQ